MLRIKFKLLHNLTNDNLSTFYPLTFPAISRESQAVRPLCEPLLSVAATLEERIIGLAIVERPVTDRGRLVSYSVMPSWRHEGIGGRLMTSLLRVCTREGVQQLEVEFPQTSLSTSSFELILIRHGWDAPREHLINGEASILALQQRFLSRIPPIKMPYSCIHWSALTQSQAAMAAAVGASAGLTPWRQMQHLHTTCSLALLHHNEFVGWLLAHQFIPGVLSYSSLYIAPKHRSHARGLALLAEGIARQNPYTNPLARAAIHVDSQELMRFYQRHLRDLVQNGFVLKRSSILLSEQVSGEKNKLA